MKLLFLNIIFIILFFLTCNPATKENVHDFINVSYDELLMYPQKYNGKIISTKGYYKRSFNISTLFPTPNDSLVNRIKRWSRTPGIWIDPQFEQNRNVNYCVNCYVEVIGLYVYDPAGHGPINQFISELTNIEYFNKFKFVSE